MTKSNGSIPLPVRVAWGVLVVFTLVVFVVSLPEYHEHLQSLCQKNCAPGQLTPATVQALQNINLSMNTYALFRLILAMSHELVGIVVGGILIWRRSDDWMAFLVALMFIMIEALGTISHSIWRFPASLLIFLTYAVFF